MNTTKFSLMVPSRMRALIESISLIHVLAVMMLIVWIVREISWYAFSKKSAADLLKMNDSLSDLLFKLSIDRMTEYNCSLERLDGGGADDNPHNFLSDNISNSFLTGANIPDPKLLDIAGLMQIFLVVCAVTIEALIVKKHCLKPLETEDSMDQQFVRRLNAFLAQTHPFFTILSSLFVWACACVGWIGIGVDRNNVVDGLLKLIVVQGVGVLLAYVIQNIWRISSYFPKDSTEWRKSLTDINWWLWLFQRSLGVLDLQTGVQAMLWTVSIVFTAMPFRYFFYYRRKACAVSERNTVFLVNMLIHTGLLLACCFYVYAMLFVKLHFATTAKVSTTMEELRRAQREQERTSIWQRMYRWLDSSIGISLICLLSLANTLLAAIRVLWHLVVAGSGCSWYGWSLAWVFLHVHILFTLYALPAVNAFMQRHMVEQAHKTRFLDTFHTQTIEFLTKQRQAKKWQQAAESKEALSLEDEVALFSENAKYLFELVAVKSMVYYIFLEKESRKEKSAAAAEGAEFTAAGDDKKDESEDNRFLSIFQAMMQKEAANINQQNSAAAEEAEEVPGNSSGRAEPTEAGGEDDEVSED